MNEKLNKNDFLGLKSLYKGLSQPLTTKEVYTFANQTRPFVIDSNEAIEESMDKLQKEENICKSIEKKTSKTLVKHNETNKKGIWHAHNFVPNLVFLVHTHYELTHTFLWLT
jgi:hypothetical protein